MAADAQKIAESKDLADKLVLWSATARLTGLQDCLLDWFIDMLRHELKRPSGRELTGAQACYEVEVLGILPGSERQ